MAALRFDILTLFPEMFGQVFDHGVVGRARAAGLIEIEVSDIRDRTTDPHRTVDDSAYGGGFGMVMKPEPVTAAIDATRRSDSWVVLLTPQGAPLSQTLAAGLANRPHLILVCGRYEGIDDRVRQLCVDQEISIGDYVLTGGELPAMVVVDAVSRLVPGVVGKQQSVASESHSAGLLEHPHYTRPREFRGLEPPSVLFSGNHAEIARWRHLESLRRTLLRRPDLLRTRGMTPEEAAWLRSSEPDAMKRLESEGFSADQPPPT